MSMYLIILMGFSWRKIIIQTQIAVHIHRCGDLTEEVCELALDRDRREINEVVENLSLEPLEIVGRDR